LSIAPENYPAHVKEVLDRVEVVCPWIKDGRKLVAKPDMLIKRRGKSGLLCLNKEWEDSRKWIEERAGKLQKVPISLVLKLIQVEHVQGYLTNFLVEPFVPHPQETEYYININSVREGDYILFYHEGGVDIGDVDAKASKLLIGPSESFPSIATVKRELLSQVPEKSQDVLLDFIIRLYSVYVDLQFTYLEINPLVVIPTEDSAEVHYLDLAAKLDQTADFEVGSKWSIARTPQALGLPAPTTKAPLGADHGPPMVFPAPFGRELSKEESYVAELDAKTGASLKLTVLNPNGRVWTLVAGGGASVVYADAIACAGFADELANYGEYSGAPTEGQTYEYAKTVLDLLTRSPAKGKKVLFIGGGIANFSDVAQTFKGVCRALREYSTSLKAGEGVSIWVRRAGPNYQTGLKMIKSVGEELGLEMHVYGPETHGTLSPNKLMKVSGIVPMALLGKGIAPEPNLAGTSNDLASTP
jgi:ATP citrate (pro-S)-lyase